MTDKVEIIKYKYRLNTSALMEFAVRSNKNKSAGNAAYKPYNPIKYVLAQINVIYYSNILLYI